MNKPNTIDEYIANYPEHVRGILEQVRQTIRSAAPNATEAIRYGIPTFVQSGSLVHFAAFKNHIGFYATPTGHAAFQAALATFKQGKGSVQFPLSQPMPLELIGKIVRFRVEEVVIKNK
ncbi:MAG: iron chaperone [Saprospiraceae bacterium]